MSYIVRSAWYHLLSAAARNMINPELNTRRSTVPWLIDYWHATDRWEALLTPVQLMLMTEHVMGVQENLRLINRVFLLVRNVIAILRDNLLGAGQEWKCFHLSKQCKFNPIGSPAYTYIVLGSCTTSKFSSLTLGHHRAGLQGNSKPQITNLKKGLRVKVKHLLKLDTHQNEHERHKSPWSVLSRRDKSQNSVYLSRLAHPDIMYLQGSVRKRTLWGKT